MRCWYTWLISQDLWIKGADVTESDIRHSDTKRRAKVLNPYKYKCVLGSTSTKSTKVRIKIIDKVIGRCMAL